MCERTRGLPGCSRGGEEAQRGGSRCGTLGIVAIIDGLLFYPKPLWPLSCIPDRLWAEEEHQ